MSIETIYREESGRILATLIRLLGDFDTAEEAMQDAFAAALEQWPSAGTPSNPRAWLVGTARHKAIDKMRRRARFEKKQEEIAAIAALEQQEYRATDSLEALDSSIPDDRLRLIFTCCHPSLAPEAQIALTLRTLCGLSTEEIARAFLVPPTTMAGPGGDFPGRGSRRTGAARGGTRTLRRAGRHRGAPRAGAPPRRDRLAPDRGAL
jgi:RNA polymerase sigma-70 factor (ECF subfamily)